MRLPVDGVCGYRQHFCECESVILHTTFSNSKSSEQAHSAIRAKPACELVSIHHLHRLSTSLQQPRLIHTCMKTS